MRRLVQIIHLSSRYRRRAVAARAMAKRGYGKREIGRLLRLSPRRVADALAGVAANGRIWTNQELDALKREMRRAA